MPEVIYNANISQFSREVSLSNWMIRDICEDLNISKASFNIFCRLLPNDIVEEYKTRRFIIYSKPCLLQGINKIQNVRINKKRIHQTLSTNFQQQCISLNTKKPSGTMTYVGCTKEFLLEHLNNGKYTMEDYMTNKKGDIKFHIDHIIPSKYFMDQLILDEDNNITNEEVLYRWWNYRNLRVWSAILNMSKNDDMDYDLFKQHGIEDLL